MKAFLFPGQGAQRIGMGAELFEAFPDLVAEADGCLGYSIRELCLNGPIERLTRTNFTQPAIYVVSALKYLEQRAARGRPDCVLGHSVGEYVALFAGGVFDFRTGLSLVQKRGELMDRAQSGGMAAVLGLEAGAIEEVIRRHNLADIYPANFNTPRQIVLSGRRDAVIAAEPLFREAGASHYVVLQVGGAFHTPLMAEAGRDFAAFVADIPFEKPQIPVICNVTARPHSADRIRERMIEQITAPVRWCDSIRYLLAKGARFEDFTEIGPEGQAVVKPMVKRIEMEAGPLDGALLAAEEAAAQPTQPLPAPPSAPSRSSGGITPANLGSRAFCDDFGVRHPCLCGAMYQGISSVDLVARAARAGILAFFGAGGLPMPEVAAAIAAIRAQIPEGAPFGVNFLAHVNRPHLEDELTDLLLAHGVCTAEASAFMEVTPALVRYRAKGLEAAAGNRIAARNRIIAKVSRPEVAAQFLAPAPERIVTKLVESGALDADEAELLRHVPMADAICVESDSGGHTDQGRPFTLIPAMLRIRDAAADRFPRFGRVHVGAGGGIGTPEAAAAVFVLGAEFIVTGSVNQCTVEARTSDVVKDLLEGMGVNDTAYAPSGEMFELGSKVQVLKKGLFFPARAEKLVALYRQFDSLDAIDAATRAQIEERYLHCRCEEVFAGLCASYPPAEIERAERMPKHKMALVFKRYFRDSSRWALAGDVEHKVDFQIHCGPALGAFNQWVADDAMASWRQRHADDIALRLLEETSALLNRRFSSLAGVL
ncbi:ACP S-malonyltransferase [Shumkonia mesophila]|uniref:ACP S-malonyltransferase n=1 Tax=Shumkonia mesophila TaxID=2838854 RepID=UPI0029346C6C|nr:ACP S-malonyltransferase [Shumkonia mesophila]